MKNKQFSILNNGGGRNYKRLCKMHKQALAMISSMAVLFTSVPFVSYSNFTANAVEDEHVHNMMYYEAIEPTCFIDGRIECWYCNDCRRYFSDEAGTGDGGYYKDFLLDARHNVIGGFDFDRLSHWGTCTVCNENILEHHTFDDSNKCSVCDAVKDTKFYLEDNVDFSDDEENGNWSASATLEDNGYEWDATTNTLTLGDIYIDGMVNLPYEDSTIVIADGAKPVICAIASTNSLTIKGNGTLTATIQCMDESMLNITDGAEVIAYGIMWTTNDGIVIKNNGKLKVSKMLYANKITMDDTAELEMNINTEIHSTENNGFADLEKYLPSGYQMITKEPNDVEKIYFFIPQGTTVVEVSEEQFEVQDEAGNTITDTVTFKGMHADKSFFVYDNIETLNENATLEKDGYEWNATENTLTLGDVYFCGNVTLPAENELNTISIVDGANPVISGNINSEKSLTVKGNGILTTNSFNHWQEEVDNTLTITDGAELITNYISWLQNGGIAIKNNGKLKVLNELITNKIKMDDTAKLEIDINTGIYFYGNIENDFADIEKYIPSGYQMETKDRDGINVTFIIPQGAKVVALNVEQFEVQDNDGNKMTGTVTLKKTYADGIGEHLKGHSISLDGNIGVNFYMELDKSVVADENAYMQFTLPNEKTASVNVSDAKIETVDGKQYYVFSCNVAPKDFMEEITAQIITSDGKTGTLYTYTVKEYIDYILMNGENYDKKTLILVSDIMNYCEMASLYFNNQDMGEISDEFINDDLAEYEKKITGELPEGMAYYGTSLLLESETTVRHYFRVTDDTVASKYNLTKKKDGYYYIDIPNISAGQLTTAQSTKIGDWSISYSPMSYVYDVLKSEETDVCLKNLCKALYLYGTSAEKYQKG